MGNIYPLLILVWKSFNRFPRFSTAISFYLIFTTDLIYSFTAHVLHLHIHLALDLAYRVSLAILGPHISCQLFLLLILLVRCWSKLDDLHENNCHPCWPRFPSYTGSHAAQVISWAKRKFRFNFFFFDIHISSHAEK